MLPSVALVDQVQKKSVLSAYFNFVSTTKHFMRYYSGELSCRHMHEKKQFTVPNTKSNTET